MNWERANNPRTLDQIYENFRNIIAINAEPYFMTTFKKDNITYIASPNNFDQYPNEFLTPIKEFYLWKLESD